MQTYNAIWQIMICTRHKYLKPHNESYLLYGIGKFYCLNIHLSQPLTFLISSLLVDLFLFLLSLHIFIYKYVLFVPLIITNKLIKSDKKFFSPLHFLFFCSPLLEVPLSLSLSLSCTHIFLLISNIYSLSCIHAHKHIFLLISNLYSFICFNTFYFTDCSLYMEFKIE